MSLAPVALFVYNRPWHTRQTVEALLANAEAPQTQLYIYSDAPKDMAAGKAVAEVRAYLREISGLQSVSIIERESNYGLARSIIDGVTSVCNAHGSVIVLEDDLVTSPYFLRYMNEGLNKYKDEQRVISIHGYVYPVEQKLPETFFLKGADCWGWATWKRGWDLFEADGSKLLTELSARKLSYQFDFDGTYPFTKMLKNQIRGRNNSWAIRWYASAFLANKLTLYPGRSLVNNIGMDGSGDHCSETNNYSSGLAKTQVEVCEIFVDDSLIAREIFIGFHRKTQPSMLIKVAKKIFQKLEKVVMKQQYAPGFMGLWLNPFYHSRYGLRKAIGKLAPNLTGRLLDVGCGRKPYREMFLTHEYVGLEIDTPENRASKQADFFYDGANFPFKDAQFDGVVCNQVLEHVFTPDLFLGEIHRALKADGLLLLTVPFVWDEHEQPWDYARYSSFGLKSLLNKNGFEVLEQDKVNADVRVLFQLINAYLYKVLWTRWKIVNLFICAVLMAPFNILGVLLYRLLPANPDLYLDQVVLARKIAND